MCVRAIGLPGANLPATLPTTAGRPVRSPERQFRLQDLQRPSSMIATARAGSSASLMASLAAGSSTKAESWRSPFASVIRQYASTSTGTTAAGSLAIAVICVRALTSARVPGSRSQSRRVASSTAFSNTFVVAIGPEVALSVLQQASHTLAR